MATRNVVTRAEVEDFLYHEAALLDDWKLDEWQALLTDDAAYYVPPNDQPDRRSPQRRCSSSPTTASASASASSASTIPNCHAEYPRVAHAAHDLECAHRRASTAIWSRSAANFVCYRYRRYERIREYVGVYRYMLKRSGDGFRIKERRVLIDAHELGTLGSVSFILVNAALTCHARQRARPRRSASDARNNHKRKPMPKLDYLIEELVTGKSHSRPRGRRRFLRPYQRAPSGQSAALSAVALARARLHRERRHHGVHARRRRRSMRAGARPISSASSTARSTRRGRT